jgi:hypothetical protein
MRPLLALFVVLSLGAAAPSWAQSAERAAEGVSDAQRADYQKLKRDYFETFRLLGRARFCNRVEIDERPFFQEIARRHGEKSEVVALARAAFTAGFDNTVLPLELDPAPPAPMPCDVIVYMKDMRLPEVPASLVGIRWGDAPP